MNTADIIVLAAVGAAIVLAVIALCHYAKVQVFNREKKES